MLLYIVTYQYRESHGTIYRLTEMTVHTLIQQILFIYESKDLLL